MSRPKLPAVEQIEIEIIEDDGTRLRRSIHEGTVERLMSSMNEIGLKTPIVVRHYPDRPGKFADDSVVLVIGGHRLEAARRLGWEKIACEVLGPDADDRRMRQWEIAENLDRAELTVGERAEHITAWMRLEKPKVFSAQVEPKINSKGDTRGRPESGINAATRELGIERNEAQRSVKIASMAPEAKEAARELGLDDNQAALLKAAKQPTPEKQLESLRQQAEAAEKAKRNHNENRTVAMETAGEYANWLMDHIGLNELPTVIGWLEGSKPKDVIAALRRLSRDPSPLMNSRFGVRQ